MRKRRVCVRDLVHHGLHRQGHRGRPGHGRGGGRPRGANKEARELGFESNYVSNQKVHVGISCLFKEDKWHLVPAFLRVRGLVRQHIDSFDHFIERYFH